MPWLKMDDQFIFHEKARLVGKEGRNLQVTALCYCAGQLNDGLIRDGLLPTIFALAECDDGPATVERLVEVGMWERVDGGYQIHDYLDYNPSRTQVLAERAAARKRMFALRSGEHGQNVIDPVPGPVPVPVPHVDDGDARASSKGSEEDDELPGTMPIADQRKVLALDDVGVGRGLALELASKCTLPRIQAVIAHARASPGLQNPTGYIVSILRSGQALPKPPLPGGKNVRDRANQRGPAEARTMPAAAEVMRDASGNPVSLMSLVGLSGP
jgi:hypothetical protein